MTQKLRKMKDDLIRDYCNAMMADFAPAILRVQLIYQRHTLSQIQVPTQPLSLSLSLSPSLPPSLSPSLSLSSAKVPPPPCLPSTNTSGAG